MENFEETIKSNMNSQGGGLAVNITGKFESNRHALAKITKFTFGQVAKALRLKKNGSFNITAFELLELYSTLFGEPEWHHAGFLPKTYGGKMKKTYFLDEIPSAETFNKWLQDFENHKINKEDKRKSKEEKKLKQQKFLAKYGNYFSRLGSLADLPKYNIISKREMNGKFGWFEPNFYHIANYNLTIHYSGYSFKSKKTLDKYLQL